MCFIRDLCACPLHHRKIREISQLFLLLPAWLGKYYSLCPNHFFTVSFLRCLIQFFTFVIFLLNQVVMTLLMAACSAATAMGYLGRYGNKHAGWIAICGYLDSYCDRITVSVTLSYIAFLFYFFLAIISASKARPSTAQADKWLCAAVSCWAPNLRCGIVL